ncbi:hypothetical protein PK35_06770 [Tamlana nanhaiensis]|uniref:Uncharacterized protein n=1 Tax=Neotamlana nanhaiensis TaxID=1382798 RepID=A0A0D7W6T6_9FLAO|nr:hypothetical protein [Tamlana nanhaiensis]KJD33542.1 hypothetical protein PK35_06770 [Tamlana nanhaiensis]
MNFNKINYYNESGKTSNLSISLFVLSGLLLITVLGYLYASLILFIPILYFNFLITIGYAFAVSFVTRILSIAFKIRNRKKTISINIVFALFAVYIQWVSYIFLISFENNYFIQIINNFDYFLLLLIRPDLVVLDIIEISKVGLWSIGSSGVYLRGLVLWLVWLVEASIIIFVAWNNFRQFEIIPFSEKDNKWFKKRVFDFDFEYIPLKKQFIDDFEKNPSEAISQLKRGNGLRHSKITLYQSETETKSIISIDNIIITQRGKGKKDITKVLKLSYIDNNYLIDLKSKFRLKKASIFDN